MINKNQIEEIASRYGIKVTYVEEGKGGFIVDDSKQVIKSIKSEVEDMFFRKSLSQSLSNEYSLSDECGAPLLAA